LQPPPEKPVVSSFIISNAVILSATPMAGLDSCMSSQFQITTTQGDYTTPLLNTIRDREDIFENTGIPDYSPINKNAGIDLTALVVADTILANYTDYWYRVRYRDDNLKWSPWSDELTIHYNGIDDMNFSSGGFSLSQNIPNPFSTSTMIRYQMNTGGFVSLKVYDMVGREIATLVNEAKHPGNYSVQFPGTTTGYAPGSYYVQMKFGNLVQTRKMVVVR